MICNSVIFSKNNSGIVLLAINVLILFLLGFPLRERFGSIASRNIYLWSNVFTTSFLMWTTSSPHYALVLPIFIIIAALIVEKRSFFTISIYCIISIIILGVIRVNSEGNVLGYPVFGYWQMFDGIIILTSAIYTAWQTTLDMKYTLKSANRQAQKVTESYIKIKGLENFDTLTGLISKENCEKKYISLFENINTDKEEIIVLLFNLDNFKSINDYYNHSVGDNLLKKVSQRVMAYIDEGDIACRLGGDEFILIIKRPMQFDIELFANHFFREISRPISLGIEVLDITASIGITIATKQDSNLDDVRHKSALAMCKAKKRGENNIYSYNDGMHQRRLNKIAIVNNLKEAFKNGGLEVYLQPKIDMKTGKVSSAEALLRWTENNDQNIGPAEFIPLIESTELICEIGEWVIHHACRLCKEWHDNGYTDLSIAVNISSSQFLRGGLEKIIEKECSSPNYLQNT